VSQIRYREIEGMPDEAAFEDLGQLSFVMFAPPGSDNPSQERHAESFRVGLRGRPWVFTVLAYDAEQLVGFKIGRSEDPREFESWRGGVLESHRRQGIARELAQRQEAWCRAQSFRVICTQTDPDNAPMLMLNLAQGFIISGTNLKRGEKLRVDLLKKLS
jgi:GNAT superfamily N-acetyltransferase